MQCCSVTISHVWLFVTPWAAAQKAPLSMGFSRQGYWSGLPFPSLRDLPNPVIEPRSPTLQADSLPTEPPGWLYLWGLISTLWRRQWHPTPVLLPGKSHGRRSLEGCSPWGRQESDTTEWLHFFTFTFMHWRRKWQPTPVFLPGESRGRGSLVGCCLWGCTELDTTEVT